MPGLENTNRAWLYKQCEYDMLCKMSNRLQSAPPYMTVDCVLYLLTGDQSYGRKSVSPSCPMTNFTTQEEYEKFTCQECIMEWLNKEHS